MWRKSKTSGTTQDVERICLASDEERPEFCVVQHGAGFWHLERVSCFREIHELAALEETLRARGFNEFHDMHKMMLIPEETF